MKAIVFGGAGFLGSHVADVLSNKGFQVTIFDKKESPYIRSEQKMIRGDIENLDSIKDAIKDQDYVLNFAAVAGLKEARMSPISSTKINILGNLNILEAIKESHVKRYVFASSYYVYSEYGTIYKTTKQSCELFIEEYSRLYDLPFTILRFGSLYGDRAGADNSVYNILKQGLETRRIVREGSPEDIREYIHVLDAAIGTLETMVSDEYLNKHVILAGETQIKVGDMLEMVKEILGEDVLVEYKNVDAHDLDHYKITPYSFRPKPAVRYRKKSYLDLGQGMLELLYQISMNDTLEEKRGH